MVSRPLVDSREQLFVQAEGHVRLVVHDGPLDAARFELVSAAATSFLPRAGEQRPRLRARLNESHGRNVADRHAARAPVLAILSDIGLLAARESDDPEAREARVPRECAVFVRRAFEGRDAGRG